MASLVSFCSARLFVLGWPPRLRCAGRLSKTTWVPSRSRGGSLASVVVVVDPSVPFMVAANVRVLTSHAGLASHQDFDCTRPGGRLPKN